MSGFEQKFKQRLAKLAKDSLGSDAARVDVCYDLPRDQWIGRISILERIGSKTNQHSLGVKSTESDKAITEALERLKARTAKYNPQRKGNRFCVLFKEFGPVPVNYGQTFDFDTMPPKCIGDDAIIWAGGKRHFVRLLKSHGHAKDGTYLVRLRVA